MDRLDFKSGIRRPDGFCCLFSKCRLEGSPACARLNLNRLLAAKMPNQQIHIIFLPVHITFYRPAGFYVRFYFEAVNIRT
jgi:hypothetical protein